LKNPGEEEILASVMHSLSSFEDVCIKENSTNENYSNWFM